MKPFAVSLRVLTLCTFVFANISLASEHRGYSSTDLAAGQNLFVKNCAVCHGEDAGGTVKDWHIADENGKFPPPPLNGTAHTWHHTVPALYKTIRDGTLGIGGSMPPMGEHLNRDEILLVINWLTSLWPDEIYANWLQMHE